MFNGHDLTSKKEFNSAFTVYYISQNSSGENVSASNGFNPFPIGKDEQGYKVIHTNYYGQSFVGTMYSIEEASQPDAEYMLTSIGVQTDSTFCNQYFIAKLNAVGSITTKEYDEINAIAEDVLGGVE